MRNIYLLFLLFLLTFTNLFAQNKDFSNANIEKIKLQLQWQHQFQFAGFYAAKEKGFYKDLGLDVEFIEFNPKTNVVDEVLVGNTDYALTYSSLFSSFIQGKSLVFISNFFKQSPLLIVTQENIKSPLDLKGKKVMGLLDSNHKDIVLSILQKFNLKEQDLKNITQEYGLESFINKKVDAISLSSINEIYTLNKLGIKYKIIDPAAYGIKYYDLNLFTTKKELLNNPTRVENFKNASNEGWKYALENKEEIVELIIKKYNTQNKTKEALLFEAQQIEYLMLNNIYPIGSIDIQNVKIFTDNLAQISNLEKKSQEELESFIYKSEINTLKLSQEEKEYLKNKKELKLCVDPNWLPLEKIENSKHIGITAEYIETISKKINIPITLVQTTQWNESLENIKQRRCDILSLAEKTPSRDKYLDFTTPYITMPYVIATKSGLPFIDNLEDIKSKTIGIVKNYSVKELLQNKYPDINLVEVNSPYEGLVFVEQDKNFAFLDNAMVINNEIQKNNMNFISITGQFSESFNLSIASRNDEPILNQILQKALLSIDDKQKLEFMQKWNNINYQTKSNNQVIVQILFFTIVFISIFIYWNIKLKEEIRNKELVQKQLKDSEEKFRTLFDIAPILLNAFDKNGKVILWNKECENTFGWTLEEIQKEENPLSLFYPNTKILEELKKSFADENQRFYKDWTPYTKEGDKIITRWANIKLQNDEIINIGYDITQERNKEIALKEKTEQLNIAKEDLEKLNSSLEKRIQYEISKNTEQQIMLMNQSKLVQMGEMIENIAHQWRQPLAQINSSVLLIDAALNKNRFENTIVEMKLEEIENLTNYMSKTINDFQNFFNPNKEKVTFEIAKAIEKAIDIVKGLIQMHYINVQINIEKDLLCHSYLEELQQVILIILNNAIDALVLKEISSPQMHLTVYEEDKNIVINIEDNALGINKIYQDKIFEPYFTTKEKTQGTGIGLYMAKLIIENGLKGELSMKNILNGSCFTIKIPKGKR